MRVLTGPTMLLAMALAPPAQAMSVADFMARGEALKAKGMMALFSSDLKLIKAELSAIGPAWRSQAPAARPPVCPPAAGTGRMDEPFIRSALLAVPPAERSRVQVKDAMISALNERYRCK